MTGLLRLEAAGVLRARWFTAACVLAIGLSLFFVALATRESSVLQFTGFARVVTGVGLAAVWFLPLLGVFSTSQAIPHARQQGVLEWYLSHPVSRDATFAALFLPRLAAVAGPIAGSVLVLGVASLLTGHAVPFGLLARFLLLLVGQGFCFAALGMLVSAVSRSPEQALLSGLVLWMASVALIDFALIAVMLRWRLPPEVVFGLSAVNPVQAARLGLLAGTDPDLGLLGPVGTWIAVHLGDGGTLAYALAWPVILGGAALGAARTVFVRRDVS